MRIFTVTIVATGLAACSAAPLATLRCNGVYSTYSKSGANHLELQDLLVTITKQTITIADAAAFGGTYNIISSGDSGVRFQSTTVAASTGTLNRFTGQVRISTREGRKDDPEYHLEFVGSCKQAPRLF